MANIQIFAQMFSRKGIALQSHGEAVAQTRLFTTRVQSVPQGLERLGWLLIFFGFPMGNTNFGLAFLFLGAAARVILRKRFDWNLPHSDPFYIAGWAFLGVMLISGVLSAYPGMGLVTTLAFFLMFTLILCGSKALLSENHAVNLDRVMLVVLTGTIIGSIYALYTYFGLGSDRAYAVSVGINGLGTISAFTTLLSFAYGIQAWHRIRWQSVMAFVAMILSLGALVLSFSRGGWLGFAFSIALFVFFMLKSGKLSWKLVVALIVIGVLAMGVLFSTVPSFQERFVSAFEIESNLNRLVLWQTTLLVIKDHPIIGIGGGNFAEVYEHYRPDVGLPKTPFAHNIFLQVAVEFGILGFITFFTFLGIALVRGWHVASRAGIFLQAVYCGLWGMLAHDLFDNVTLGVNAGGLLWLGLGLFVHLYHKHQSQNGNQTQS